MYYTEKSSPQEHGDKNPEGAEVQIAFGEEKEGPADIEPMTFTVKGFHIPVRQRRRPVGKEHTRDPKHCILHIREAKLGLNFAANTANHLRKSFKRDDKLANGQGVKHPASSAG